MTSPKVPIQPPIPQPEQHQDQRFGVRAERKYLDLLEGFVDAWVDAWQASMNVVLAILPRLIGTFIGALFLVMATVLVVVVLLAIVALALEGVLHIQVVTPRFENDFAIFLSVIMMVIVVPFIFSSVFDEEMLIDLWSFTPHSWARAQKLALEAIKQGDQALAYKRHNDAMRFFQKAAVWGYAEAQCNIGILYQNGWGVPKDYAEAMQWFRMAADPGDATAQTNIGVMYANGQGVPKDYAQAMQWFRKAADQGNATAQNNIGNLYYNGWGVPKDYGQARHWYNLAAAQGNELAKQNLATLPAN